MIWEGPQDSSTLAPSGDAVPMSAMEEARALMEHSKQRQAEATK